MPKRSQAKSGKLGSAPGSLVFVGEQRVQKTILKLSEYNASEINESVPENIQALANCKTSPLTSWIQVIGVHDASNIEELGALFNLHPLLLEDVLNTEQRPKFEVFDDYLFIVLKQLHHVESEQRIESEQISIVVGQNYLLQFQESSSTVFNPIVDRLQKVQSKIRKRGTDYLAFSLIDILVDHYIDIIERLGESIEKLEDELLSEIKPDQMDRIHAFKKEIHLLRKNVRPARDLIATFGDSESDFIQDETSPFIQDLEDHIMHAVESIEAYREMLSDLFNTYNSIQNSKLNDILRVLTIFSVIFIPLTFLAGIYGMNFEHFPELKYTYSYPIFWIVLLLLASGMIYYFKRKKWL